MNPSEPYREHSNPAGGPRERFLAAIERRPGQGVSWDLGYAVTGFSRTAHEKLCAYLGLEPSEPSFWSMMLQTVYPNVALHEQVCGDLHYVSVRAPLHVSVNETEKVALASYCDEWGIVRKLSGNGLYYDIVESPLAGCQTVKDCRTKIRLPEDSVARVEGLREKAEEIRRQGYAVGATCFAGIFEMFFWLRGFKQAYLDFARNPQLAETIMDMLLEVQMQFWESLCDELHGLLDIALLTEDLGTQHSLMISPDTFRRLVRPRIEALIAFIKQRNPGTRILLHSCGAVYPLIGDLIDMGVDLLNPLQPQATGMNPAKLKAEFGDDIVFHGAVDIQSVLCRGTPDEVQEHVRSLIDVLGRGGGYVVAPAHCVQADVPPENIIAMVDAIRGLAAYPELGE